MTSLPPSTAASCPAPCPASRPAPCSAPCPASCCCSWSRRWADPRHLLAAVTLSVAGWRSLDREWSGCLELGELVSCHTFELKNIVSKYSLLLSKFCLEPFLGEPCTFIKRCCVLILLILVPA